MAKAKLVLADYAWDSLDAERKTWAEIADLVVLNVKTPRQFAPYRDCDALLIPMPGRSRPPSWRRCRTARSSRATASASTRSISKRPPVPASSSRTIRPIASTRSPSTRFALLLACARKIAFYDPLVRAGCWEVSPGKPMFRMAGSTLGLVGFSHTSRELAVRALAFGMRVPF